MSVEGGSIEFFVWQDSGFTQAFGGLSVPPNRLTRVVDPPAESWSQKLRRLVMERRAVGGDPITRGPKQRLEYRRLSQAINEVLEGIR